MRSLLPQSWRVFVERRQWTLKGCPIRTVFVLDCWVACIHILAFSVIKSMRDFVPSTFNNIPHGVLVHADMLPHATLPSWQPWMMWVCHSHCNNGKDRNPNLNEWLYEVYTLQSCWGKRIPWSLSCWQETGNHIASYTFPYLHGICADPVLGFGPIRTGNTLDSFGFGDKSFRGYKDPFCPSNEKDLCPERDE